MFVPQTYTSSSITRFPLRISGRSDVDLQLHHPVSFTGLVGDPTVDAFSFVADGDRVPLLRFRGRIRADATVQKDLLPGKRFLCLIPGKMIQLCNDAVQPAGRRRDIFLFQSVTHIRWQPRQNLTDNIRVFDTGQRFGNIIRHSFRHKNTGTCAIDGRYDFSVGK